MSDGGGKQEAICHASLHVLVPGNLLSLSLSFRTCEIAPGTLSPRCCH